MLHSITQLSANFLFSLLYISPWEGDTIQAGARGVVTPTLWWATAAPIKYIHTFHSPKVSLEFYCSDSLPGEKHRLQVVNWVDVNPTSVDMESINRDLKLIWKVETDNQRWWNLTLLTTTTKSKSSCIYLRKSKLRNYSLFRWLE